jgi:two-component system, OmpR family, sensor kinase
MFRSLQWRIQIWHAVVLFCVLALFGTYVYSLHWRVTVQQIDDELDRTADVIQSRLRRLFVGSQSASSSATGKNEASTNPLADQKKPTNKQALSDLIDDEGDGNTSAIHTVGLPEDILNPPDRPSASGLYFIIWNEDGTLLEKSISAPEDLPFPDFRMGEGSFPGRMARTRGSVREVIHVNRFGVNILVGRSMRLDLAQQTTTAFLIFSAGVCVLVVGLAGGWYVAAQSLRPIAAMSVTAASIADLKLNERIDTRDTASELGQLGGVLNKTFDRLQGLFEKQTQFTADASHELRTPVSVILAQTQLALSKERSPEAYREALGSCLRAASRMKSLIDHLLILARLDVAKQAFQGQPLSLDVIVADTCDLLRTLAESHQVTLDSQIEHVSISGERNQLTQVITNLINNAVRYNRPQGHVSVELKVVNGMAQLVVRDTGQGIPAENLPYVFDRFYRVDKVRSRNDGGSGLGLSICKEIVEAHGGTIQVTSELDVGTEFIVRFPTLPAGTMEAAELQTA